MDTSDRSRLSTIYRRIRDLTDAFFTETPSATREYLDSMSQIQVLWNDANHIAGKAPVADADILAIHGRAAQAPVAPTETEQSADEPLPIPTLAERPVVTSTAAPAMLDTEVSQPITPPVSTAPEPEPTPDKSHRSAYRGEPAGRTRPAMQAKRK